MSEETPSELSKFDGETSRRIGVVEDVAPAAKNPFDNSVQGETRQEDSPLDEQVQQPFGEIFDKLNVEVCLPSQAYTQHVCVYFCCSNSLF